MNPPITHISFPWTTALWEARPSDCPSGFTLGRNQYGSTEGTFKEQSGPERRKKSDKKLDRQIKLLRSVCSQKLWESKLRLWTNTEGYGPELSTNLYVFSITWIESQIPEPNMLLLSLNYKCSDKSNPRNLIISACVKNSWITGDKMVIIKGALNKKTKELFVVVTYMMNYYK